MQLGAWSYASNAAVSMLETNYVVLISGMFASECCSCALPGALDHLMLCAVGCSAPTWSLWAAECGVSLFVCKRLQCLELRLICGFDSLGESRYPRHLSLWTARCGDLHRAQPLAAAVLGAREHKPCESVGDYRSSAPGICPWSQNVEFHL